MLLVFNMELYKLSSKTGEMKSVKMSPGKAAAQSGHATLGAYRATMRMCPNAVRDWLRIGQMKITVKCPSVQELLELEERCASAGLNTYLIRDAGHTEIEPGSRTVLAVGPAPASAMDEFTRHLAVLRTCAHVCFVSKLSKQILSHFSSTSFRKLTSVRSGRSIAATCSSRPSLSK